MANEPRLPTGLYFTVFTLMVIWWIELYHRSTNLQKGFLGQSKYVFIAINAVVYIFLLIVIIIFAVKAKSSVRMTIASVCVGVHVCVCV